jgi:hypothetical protein
MEQNSSITKAIRRAYFEPDASSAAFSGLDTVYKQAKKFNSDVKREDVKRYLQGEQAYTLHRQQRHRFKRLKTVPTGLNSDWQCDLADFQKVSRENNGFRYLLVCIDVLSRKIYAAPTKSKNSTDMKEAFDKIFEKSGGIRPAKLYSDQGLEFQARPMLDYFEKKLGIQKRVMYSPNIHAGVVERAHRTIKGRLYRYFTQNNTTKWVDIIDTIINGINNTINRTNGVAPNSVTDENSMALLRKVYKQPVENQNPKFQVGDIVRIDKEKGVFGKYYLPNFTEELFRISAVKTTNPPHYKIVDLEGEEIKGVFYEEELSKTNLEPNRRIGEVLRERKIRSGQNQYLIHWIGEPQAKNEWIKEGSDKFEFIN